MRSRSGYSLVSVLVVTAIGGIVAVMIMALIDNVTKVMMRGNVTDAFEGSVRTVAGVLSNPDYCDNALRGTNPGDRIVYPLAVANNPVGPPPGGNEVEIQNIFAQKDADTPGATALMSSIVGNSLSMMSGGVSISSIRFRERTRQVGRGVMRRHGVDYDSYAGEIEIMINAPGGAVPGGVIRRTIPYNPFVDRTTREIVGCYTRDRSVQELCVSMGGIFDEENGSCEAMINPRAVRCDNVCAGVRPTGGAPPHPPPHPPHYKDGGWCMIACEPYPPGVRKVKLYHLLGFDYISAVGTSPAQAVPLCACSVISFNAPAPPPIPAPGPAPGPPAPRPRPPRPPPSN